MKRLSLAGVRNALIVAPHPDDETIGAYGLIRALKARSARVRILVVTDGAGSHPGSACWPRRRLIAERQREVLAAMRGVGVPAPDVTFLGLPDGGLSVMARMRAVLRPAVARVGACDLIVLPARDDDHPDHRAIAVALARLPARRLHYLVWPNRQAASRRASHYLRLGDQAAAKRGAITRYRTQMGAITDDPHGFAISRAELAGFARPVELFREVR
ncbi:GlcNAc-PI de-N-acetylase [Sphingomonas sp. Leaf357]|uniref:PIG-L deacetylase family protein n=1 Tax=Sphingomonas sp. Leaf357 TaxID=1736350 RepID=UPI0006FF5042|nr:PIG-L family deacetylase [Sphingomonas sp. Leaf357]KQS02195.1 GlcNAc-PI de-N-acetylase [Sphingomonas sp. Leaf357]